MPFWFSAIIIRLLAEKHGTYHMVCGKVYRFIIISSATVDLCAKRMFDKYVASWVWIGDASKHTNHIIMFQSIQNLFLAIHFWSHFWEKIPSLTFFGIFSPSLSLSLNSYLCGFHMSFCALCMIFFSGMDLWRAFNPDFSTKFQTGFRVYWTHTWFIFSMATKRPIMNQLLKSRKKIPSTTLDYCYNNNNNK